VERNGTILRRAELDTIALRTGDTLEIVHFVGGG
jgi:thiamine biosynthesis protein ThiS